ncbi:acyltransferase [Desulfovibrio sp. Fe33]|uniref:acyltransferase n=1 Tax=Desulfovibrio sp. Fe33 TaxID=3020842 RepID=UPI00234CB58A|nr:acyltransferase [Desulfovibrio sp. Fe33]
MGYATFRRAVKEQKTPFYKLLYKIAVKVRRFSVPVIKPFHNFLYHEWLFRRGLWHNFWRVVYYEPMFKSQCVEVGPGFRMEYAGNGSTTVAGQVDIYFGKNIRMFDNTWIQGVPIGGRSVLKVGDDSYLSPMTRIIVAERVEIGKRCLVAAKFIADNSGHPISDVMGRMVSGGGLPSPGSIKPVKIGDFCLLGTQTIIYPGTVIGDGVVAQIGTHLKGNIPPFTIVGGNPMRILGKLPIPKEISEIVGEERYQGYLKAHEDLEI